MQNEPLELGEISFPNWNAHTDKLAEVGFLTIARRLPSLVGQVMRMAWRASPRDTLATIVLNLLGGVFTAFGLLATTGVLTALFSPSTPRPPAHPRPAPRPPPRGHRPCGPVGRTRRLSRRQAPPAVDQAWHAGRTIAVANLAREYGFTDY